MNEFEFINSITPKTYRQPSLQKGIGDDAAVFRPSSMDIVTAVDTFVENIHFSEKTMGPFAIGYRSLAANISDMAAMGAMPKFYLVSIIIPSHISDAYVQDIFKGMNDIASTFQMDLIGGDTVTGDQLSISVTIMGEAPREKARYRNAALEDDVVFVTGTLGDSRAGLEIVTHDLQIGEKDYFIRRHQMPEPRVELVQSLGTIKRMSLNDISDGIANELAEIATASQVDILINDEAIPVHDGLQQFSKADQFNWKYFGGEDFEIVGTAAESDWDTIQQQADILRIKVTRIGVVQRKKVAQSSVLLKQKNVIQPLLKQGYIHLK